MKHYFMILLFAVFASNMYCQKTDSQNLIHLQKEEFLKKERTKKMGISTLRNKSSKATRKMNKYESLYHEGISLIESGKNHIDTLNAINLIKRSANEGKYPEAYNKLGKIYKLGLAVSINLDSAFHYFDLAAKSSSLHGTYSRGYMYYKGLGCTQDYNKAYIDFKDCAFKNQKYCMYMLGLCYRNGFGVTKDSILADYWLNLALANGVDWAQDEIKNVTPEVDDSHLTIIQNPDLLNVINNLNAMKTNEFNRVVNLDNLVHNSNEMESYWVKYDYSDQHIVAIDKVNVVAKVDKGVLSASIKSNKSQREINLIGQRSLNNKFSIKGRVERNDRYIQNVEDDLIFESITFAEYTNILDNFDVLVGTINGYSSNQKEPEKPLKLFVFRNKDNIKNHLINDSHLRASPNPFSDFCNIELELAAEAECSLKIHDFSGKLLYQTSPTKLREGKYIFPWATDHGPGIYLVTLAINNFSKQIKIIKI